MNPIKKAIFLIGLYKVSAPLASICYSYYNIFLRQESSGQNNYQRLQKEYSSELLLPNKEKSYALITGGSEGIGLGIAEEFAKSGFNLILASRSQQKLDAAAAGLQSKYPHIKIITKSIDLTTTDISEYKRFIEESTEELDVRFYVNNAGIGKLSQFYDISPDEIQSYIRIHAFTPTFLTKYYQAYVKRQYDQIIKKLPYESRHQLQQKKFGIMHVGAGATEIPLLINVLYTGVKTHQKTLAFLTDQRNKELSKQGWQTNDRNALGQINTLVITPVGVSTAMIDNVKAPLVSTPEEVAYGMLREFGYRRTSWGPWRHAICSVSQYFPDLLIKKMSSKLIKPKDQH